MTEKITIEKFLSLVKECPLLDVRSPGEYDHAHIPGAYSLPLFTDEERKIVGTAYKQQSRQAAIKVGLDFFGVKMKSMVEEVEVLAGKSHLLTDGGLPLAGSKTYTINSQPPTAGVIVHCWRGGMRSAGVAWLLDLYGFKVYTLVGGYKAYRKWGRQQFEKAYSLKIIGGYTGSAKTMVLRKLKEKGQSIIDLEALANHKGSAFGAMGEKPQPTQEMFENSLAEKLHELSGPLNASPLSGGGRWEGASIEDESQRIGNLQVPVPFWNSMRQSPVYFLDVPFEERLDYLTEEYGGFEKERLVNAIIRIQKRLGGLETKNAINFLIENNHKECFRILLKYYDKWYGKGLHNRENLQNLLHKINHDKIDVNNMAALVAEASKQKKEQAAA